MGYNYWFWGNISPVYVMIYNNIKLELGRIRFQNSN